VRCGQQYPPRGFFPNKRRTTNRCFSARPCTRATFLDCKQRRCNGGAEEETSAHDGRERSLCATRKDHEQNTESNVLRTTMRWRTSLCTKYTEGAGSFFSRSNGPRTGRRARVRLRHVTVIRNPVQHSESELVRATIQPSSLHCDRRGPHREKTLTLRWCEVQNGNLRRPESRAVHRILPPPCDHGQNGSISTALRER